MFRCARGLGFVLAPSTRPQPHRSRLASEAERDKFTPEVGRVTIASRPAAVEMILVGRETAGPSRLAPERGSGGSQPAANGLPFSADQGSNLLERHAGGFQPCRLLIAHTSHIIYNRTLLAFASHHGYLPKACKAYRAKTKGKVERPFRYIREDFFLGRSFRNLDDLNAQFRQWLDQVANVRLHATTRRIVAEHFAEERPALRPLTAGAFQAVLRLERRITRDGLVSVDGNLYSVPNSTRRRMVEVHSTTNEVRILEDGAVIAVHPVLDGRGQRRIIAGHRTLPPRANSQALRDDRSSTARPGDIVALRSLAFYDAVGKRLAANDTAA